MLKKIFVIYFVLVLSGCAAITKVDNGQRVVKERVTVVSDGRWNRNEFMSGSFPEEWTTDGFPLDKLHFYVAIADGNAIQPIAGNKEKQSPIFKANMLPQEVMALYEAVFSADGSTFSPGKLTLATVSGKPGFRFEFEGIKKGNELEIKGIATGAIIDKRLYLVVFQAPKMHYFARHAARVEKLMQSIQIKG